MQTVLSSNDNNFARGAAGEPVPISLDDAQTLFHEFGHAIHAMLQNVHYPGLAGIPRDFVGYPSQANERWLLTRDMLDQYACHYQTRAPMPMVLHAQYVTPACAGVTLLCAGAAGEDGQDAFNRIA